MSRAARVGQFVNPHPGRAFMARPALSAGVIQLSPEAGMKKLLFAALLWLSSALAFAVVNVNTATQAELETLDGIGPVKAKAIIDDRTKNGPYKSLDDLDRV